jgi:predicted alpha/beta-fold hydrolase
VYYRFVKSGKLTLHYNSDQLNNFIIANTPALSKVYTPTPYLLNGDMQTQFFEIKRKLIYCPFTIKYDRQLLKLKDGGQLAIDWPIFPEVDKRMTNESFIIVILCSLTGGRNDIYVNSLIEDAAKKGYKSVLINHRGGSKTPLLVLPYKIVDIKIILWS